MKRRIGRTIVYACNSCGRKLARNNNPQLALKYALELAEEEGWRFIEGGKIIICPFCQRTERREKEVLEIVKAMLNEGAVITSNALGERLGVSRSTARDYLNRLRDKGFLRWERGDLGTLEVLRDE